MRTIGEFIFSDKKDTNNITLSPRKGASMRYGNAQSSDSSLYEPQDITFVDFPGEYDIHGHVVICYGTDDQLHYIITVDDKRYAIIQNTEVLGKETFDQIDIRVVTDESLQREIERQELEGIVQLVSDLEVSAQIADQIRADEKMQKSLENISSI